MADGLFYNDLREPFIATDQAQISPLATAVALYTPSAFPVLGGQYFSRVGKALRIKLFGRCTSAVTPGNVSFAVYYGTGASANGTTDVRWVSHAARAGPQSLSGIGTNGANGVSDGSSTTRRISSVGASCRTSIRQSKGTTKWSWSEMA